MAAPDLGSSPSQQSGCVCVSHYLIRQLFSQFVYYQCLLHISPWLSRERVDSKTGSTTRGPNNIKYSLGGLGTGSTLDTRSHTHQACNTFFPLLVYFHLLESLVL